MQSTFSITGLRRRFANAFAPRPWIYWSDLCASAGVGWGAFALAAMTPFGSLVHLGAISVAVCALLRAAIFIHEIVHFKDGLLPGFTPAWNVFVGFPLLLPSLMYAGSHSEHHRQSTFGTAADPEYAPIAYWSRWRIVWFVLSLVFVPALLLLRWGILGPVSFFVPSLRRLLITRASTLAINPAYRRPFPHGKRAVHWIVQESAVAVLIWGVCVGVWLDLFFLQWVMQWYLVTAGVAVVNQLRTLAAHRYGNSGASLDATAQLLDSVTLSGWPIPTVLAAPVGLRFHALHHILPTVPYHSLGALHRQLLAELPADSPYMRTQESGILTSVRSLVRRPSTPSATLTVECAAREA